MTPEQIAQLKADLLRTFQAFACANAALVFHSGGDTRSLADIEEAKRLIEWMTSKERARMMESEQEPTP